ncbi:MAG: MSHA biogenesis protein MshM [Oceanicoccus sp.]|jgi:MSHA biogenesis protein MshM
MYKEHFGLIEQPFGLTPNTLFFLNAQGHREALNMLQVALENGEGFVKIVGEVGTGKTMLCRKLLNVLDENYYTAYIPNPLLTPASLYRAIAEELGIKSKTRDGIREFQAAINQRLIELGGDDKKVVLVIDEAQAMPEKTLEALRLISNLETETSKLIHIVLFGQPELDRLLSQDSLRQLRQRISFSYSLSPMGRDGTRDYINHRITKAGYNGGQLFHESAVELVHKVSCGVPRLINILSHKAMMCAFGKGAHEIERTHIVSAIKDTDGVELPEWFQKSNGMKLVLFVALGCFSLMFLYLVYRDFL